VANEAPTLDQIVSSFTIAVDENIAAGVSDEVLQYFHVYECLNGACLSNTTGATSQAVAYCLALPCSTPRIATPVPRRSQTCTMVTGSRTLA
jgi:hypothetical protein